MALGYYSYRGQNSTPTPSSEAPGLPGYDLVSKSKVPSGRPAFGQQDTSTQFGQRGFPEAIQADAMVPESAAGEVGGIPGLIETGFRAPAYTAERPLALLDELTGQEGSLLDPVAEGLRGLPIVGGALDAIGQGTENLFDFTWGGVGAVANAPWAQAIDSTKTQGRDESVNGGLGLFDELMLAVQGVGGGVGAFINPNDSITVGDLEDHLLQQGWTEADFDAIRSGKSGWLDFGHKTVVDPQGENEQWRNLNDVATRMVLDPLNLAFGAGTFSKLGQVFKAGKIVAGGSAGTRSFPKAMQALKVKQAAQARAPFLTKTPLATNVGVQAIADGTYAGVTRGALSRFIIGSIKNPVKGYRNAAIATTGVQVGLNTVDEFIPEDAAIRDGWLGEVLDFAQRWGERKPLSKNDLFALGTLLKTPGRSYASKAAHGLTAPIRKSRKYQHENIIAAKMFPDLVKTTAKKGTSYTAAKAAFVERAGGQAAADNLYAHIVRAVVHEKNFLEQIPSLPEILHATSLAEAGIVAKGYNAVMDRLVRDVLEEGSLSARDFERAIEKFTSSRGGVIEYKTRGVEQQTFRPDDFWSAWDAWEPLARKTSEVGDFVRPGITADIVTTDGISWIQAHLDAIARKGDTITGDELVTLLRSEPGVMNYPGGDKLGRVFTRDGIDATVPIADVRKWLNEVKNDHAISRAEYVASHEEWEALAGGNEQLVHATNQRFNEGGGLADDVNPDMLDATSVSIQGADLRAMKAAGGDIGTAGMDLIGSMMATPAGQSFARDIPAGLKMAGIGVRSAVEAVQIIAHRGKSGYASPALLLRIDPKRPVRDALDTIAIMLETTRAPRGTAVWRGEAELTRHGLAENATELTFAARNKTTSGWDEVIQKMTDEWGDRVTINARTGVVRVLVPDVQVKGTMARIGKFEKLLGAPTRERVHFKDVVRRKSDGPAGSILLSDALATARLNRRYHTAREYIDLGVGGHAGAKVHSGSSFAEDARAQARGQYPDSADGSAVHSTPTQYELDSRTGVRGRTTEHLVDGLDDGATAERWTNTVREAGVVNTPRGGERFNFRDGDRLFASSNGSAGAIVRGDGELITWRLHPDRNAPADFPDVLAEASAHATWVRTLDITGPAGRSPVDLLAEHGWVPAVRGRSVNQLEDVVYLVRDPDDYLGMALGGRKWEQVKDGHQSLVLADTGRARAQVDGFVQALHPKQAERLAQAAEDTLLLNRMRRITELDTDLARMQNELAKPMSSSKYRQAMQEREQLVMATSTTAAQARRAAIIEKEINPGNVTYVAGAEQDISKWKPNMDESIAGDMHTLPPGEIEKLYALEGEMRAAGSYVNAKGEIVDSANYRLKRLPKQATPYYAEQGEAYRAMVQGRIAAEDGWRTTRTSKFAQGMDVLFGRQYALEMRNDFRQEMYNELLNIGATPSEANAYIVAMQHQWENSFSLGGAKMFRSPELMQGGTLNQLGRGEMKGVTFRGFKDVPATTDYADLARRASSRKYRGLAKRFPAKDGRGNLGKLIEQYYGKQTDGIVAGVGKVGRKGAYAGTVGYTILRFLLDPRWYAMNAFEADILGMARYGAKVRGVLGGKARNTGIKGHMTGKDPGVPRDPFVETMSNRSQSSELLSVEEILHANTGASGWMDPRNLYGYVAEASKLERPRITDKFFAQMIEDGSPVIDDLRRLFGDNPQTWYDEIDEMLYHIDTKGAKRAVLDNELAQQMVRAEGPAGEMYREFVTNLWRQHRDSFQEITHVFHGNVNRSNIERLINSPLLWWPVSYQLKVGKWLIDVMTKGFAGNAAELAGTGAMYKLLANHQYEMENNEDYRDMFEDHPALWRALSMFVPTTPFDMGVFLARWTRYSGSWTGAQLLGLWEQDSSYPQDPLAFMERSLALGPLYSWDIVGDIFREFEKENK